MRALFRWALPALLLAACATVEPPKGGPEDKLAPRVAGVAPAPGSINQPTQLDVTLQFDEWIAEKIPRNAVSISPPLAKKPALEVDGDHLRITSKAPLDSNTTYTLTITSGLKDLQGNAISKPFQLVFSTGPVLDSLRAEGRVWFPDSLYKRKNFPVVGLFPMGKDRQSRHYLDRFRDSSLTVAADTVPLLHREPPLYLTQTDSMGHFSFQALRPGLYQVAAFTDLNGNQRIEPQIELAGVAPRLLRLDSVAEPLWLAIGDQDTSSLRMEGASQRGNRLLEVAFSRSPVLDSAFLSPENCTIRAKRGTDTLRAVSHFQEALSGNLVLVVDSLRPETTYVVRCAAAIDSAGRKLDPRMGSAEVTWSRMTDTVAARISRVTPERNARFVRAATPIVIAYNQPISADSIAPRLVLQLLKDTVPAVVRQLDAVRLEVRGPSPWAPDQQVRLVALTPDTVIAKPDSLGHVDTTVTVSSETIAQFETLSKLKMASLTGQVPGGDAQTRIRLRSADRPTDIYEVACDAAGRFRIEDLAEGLYSVEYYRDLDGDGKHSPGKLFPPTPGEPWRAPTNYLVLPNGNDNVLEKLLPDLPSIGPKPESP